MVMVAIVVAHKVTATQWRSQYEARGGKQWDLSNLRVFFPRYAREIALTRSLSSAQNTAIVHQHSPDFLAGLRGPTFKGGKGKGRENLPPLNFFLATPLLLHLMFCSS